MFHAEAPRAPTVVRPDASTEPSAASPGARPATDDRDSIPPAADAQDITPLAADAPDEADEPSYAGRALGLIKIGVGVMTLPVTLAIVAMLAPVVWLAGSRPRR